MQTNEQKLQELCQEIYETAQRRILPLYPWVLVRVLPKEQKVGGIWTPDDKQNKTVHEAIVLETWAPQMLNCTERRSDLRLGDRIIFSYAEGMPVPFLDETKYRLVREHVNQVQEPKMGVLGKLHYEDDKMLKAKLDNLFKGIVAITLSGA